MKTEAETLFMEEPPEIRLSCIHKTINTLATQTEPPLAKAERLASPDPSHRSIPAATPITTKP
jgi:hypothetical protein